MGQLERSSLIGKDSFVVSDADHLALWWVELFPGVGADFLLISSLPAGGVSAKDFNVGDVCGSCEGDPFLILSSPSFTQRSLMKPTFLFLFFFCFFTKFA